MVNSESDFNQNLVKKLKEVWKERKKETLKKYLKLFGLWKYSGKIRSFDSVLILRINEGKDSPSVDMDYRYDVWGSPFNKGRELYKQILKIYYNLYFEKDEIHLRYSKHEVIQIGWDGCKDYVEDNFILKLTSHNQQLTGKRITVNNEMEITFDKVKM